MTNKERELLLNLANVAEPMTALRANRIYELRNAVIAENEMEVDVAASVATADKHTHAQTEPVGIEYTALIRISEGNMTAYAPCDSGQFVFSITLGQQMPVAVPATIDDAKRLHAWLGYQLGLA